MPRISPPPVSVSAVSSFDPRIYGAKFDGVTDDTTAIQAALNAAAAGSNGGTVYLPPALIVVGGQLSIPPHVVLRGTIEGPFDVSSVNGSVPTILVPNSSLGPIALASRDGGVADLLMQWPNQIAPTSASAPTVYPAAIQSPTGSAGLRVRRVTMANAYVGFSLFGGRHVVSECFIGALSQPFTVDHSLDVIRLSHIQISPFWNTTQSLTYPQTIDTWVGNNQTAIQVARADGIVLNDVFAFHGNVGLNLIDGTDSPAQSYGSASNLRLDTFSVGVRAQSTQSPGWEFQGLGVNASSAPISLPVGGAGAPIVRVRGGAFWGAATTPSNAAGGTLDIKAVQGFNPANAAKLTGGTPAVPASAGSVTNKTSVDCTVIIATGAGVTVSVVAIGGVTTGLTLAASSQATIRVPANQSISLTYAGGTPTWVWIGD